MILFIVTNCVFNLGTVDVNVVGTGLGLRSMKNVERVELVAAVVTSYTPNSFGGSNVTLKVMLIEVMSLSLYFFFFTFVDFKIISNYRIV